MSTKKVKLPSKKTVLLILFAVYIAIILPVLVVNFTVIIKRNICDEAYPDFLGRRAVIIDTDDMGDELALGDLAFFKEVAATKIREGDIICYLDNTSTVPSVNVRYVSEVVGTSSNPSFFTENADDEVGEFSVLPQDILGVYTFKLSGLGGFVKFVQSKIGFVVFAVIPVLLLFGYDFAVHFGLDISRPFRWLKRNIKNVINGVKANVRKK